MTNVPVERESPVLLQTGQFFNPLINPLGGCINHLNLVK
jgi:hypothetical protein